MKIIADKVRSFVTVSKPAEVVGDQQSAKDEQSSSVPENTPKSIDDTTQMAGDEGESAVMKMLKEDSENPAMESEVAVNIEFPDIQKKMKGILDGEGSKRTEMTSESDQNVTKKLKYESPLEFLRVPKNKYGS